MKTVPLITFYKMQELRGQCSFPPNPWGLIWQGETGCVQMRTLFFPDASLLKQEKQQGIKKKIDANL